MRLTVVLLFTLFVQTAVAADPQYPVSQIPDDLKQNMYAVIREQRVEIKVLAKNKSTFFLREVITILNPNGKRLASKAAFYDKDSRIASIKAVLYDAEGKVIRKIKTSEIYDRSSYDGFSLFSDARAKYLDLTHNVYPYTLEFEYELENRFLYSFPSWSLYDDDEVAIQKSTYTIVYPQDLKPRYKLVNAPEPLTTIDGSTGKMEWSFSNFKPSRWEKYAPDAERIVPTILAGPVDFEYGGFAGKMDTWENYGKWQWKLNQGRDILPESTLQKVRAMTEGKSDYEKIKLIYEYLQSRTRYVSIQVGIGGLQPFEAKVVDEMGYGDCKALSNYMVALLKEVGIKGYYTKIMAGENESEIFTDFPGGQSNHIIVAVPHAQDTIWLECTSQTSPFGYLGRFTQNRPALLIDESGGKIVRTPSYDADRDVVIRRANVTLASTGQGTASIRTTYRGARFDDDYHVGHFTTSTADNQKTWIQRTTRIPTYDIKTFSMKTEIKDRNPVAVVNLALSLPNFATVSGKRLFLTPNLMNRVTSFPDKVDKRKTDVVIRTPFTDIDSIEYNIPDDIYPEFLPAPVSIKSVFGEYESNFSVDQGRIIYFRRMKMYGGQYPAGSYQELIDFYKGISKADNTKLVFLNKT